jgi:hypothetical protein
MAVSETIVVTGSRVTRANLEVLGDLKLYRIPEPVTVAAMSQKQVAFLDLKGVPVEIFYDARTHAEGEEQERPSRLTLRVQNEQRYRLGVPLPQGAVALFEQQAGRPLLLGEARLADKAVGEEVELHFGESPSVRWSVAKLRADARGNDMRVTVTNANPRPVRFELRMGLGDGNKLERPSAKLARKEGDWLWATTVPAIGTATLTYHVVQPR